MKTTSEGHKQISCPKCGSPLVQGKAPFYIRGQYLGDFDSIICTTNSDFSALTESGYIEATKMAQKLGLIGPASKEDEIEDSTKFVRDLQNGLHSSASEKSQVQYDDEFIYPDFNFSKSVTPPTLENSLNRWISVKIIRKAK